jgi:acyl-CoA thioesterase-1
MDRPHRNVPAASRRALILFLAALTWPAAAAEPIRVACVGDSITEGVGAANRAQDAYPAVLGRLLGETCEVKNFGVSGATLLRKGDKPYWRLGKFHLASAFEPQIVVIKLGTNDTKPQNWKHQDEFAKDYGDLLDHFAALPSKPKVWACLPVPVYETRWGIDEGRLKEGILPVIRRVAEEKKVPLIDLYAALSGKPELFPDKIHPNTEGAVLIAKTVHTALTAKAELQPAPAHAPACCRAMMHTMEMKICQRCGKEGAQCRLCPACAGATGQCPHCLNR